MHLRHERYIAPHQEATFAALRRTAVAMLCGPAFWAQWPVRPRFHTLLVGSTGTGKSHLAHAIADTLELPIYAVSVPSWICLGARSAPQTLRTLVQWMKTSAAGGIVLLDELDKIPADTSSWTRSMTAEVYGLLDSRIPFEAMRDSDDEDDEETIPASSYQQHKEAESRLRTRFFIIGAGAFQSLWDAPPSAQIGFTANRHTTAVLPTLNQLADHIPRELTNRFRSRILFLPPLAEADYESLALEVGAILPPGWDCAFFDKALAHVTEAHVNRQGFRFVEEVLIILS